MTLRSPRKWLVVTIYGLIGVVGVISAVGGRSAGSRIVSVLVASATVAGAVRATRSGIVVSEKGIVARGRFTRQFSWNDVQRFDVRPLPHLGVWAMTTGGPWVKLMDCAPRRRSVEIAEQLEAERRRRASASDVDA